ncbi:sulfatase-like hydrolase/transferase [Reichenbachiella versicolor]|uniref:sulfatase-like hydrolase/transferase n=1 Tax=Reichenbachiella versicolor TaxID=1821036 RepID=UPI000D6E3E8B|nr:sulfatase-like hydrolase/transferase [Reichenbachiella versicolor]
MRKIVLSLIVLAISMTAFAGKKRSQPNIIILFADDISARELPIYGSSKWSAPIKSGAKGIDTSDPKFRAKTPNLDKLANEGCYVKTAWASTICGPSRAMMMTGRYAHLHKWWHNKDKGKSPEGKSGWRLHDSSPHTIAHVAKAGGYSTYWAGKTQMSDVRKFGFDEGCFTPGEGSYNRAIPTTDFRLESRKVDGKKKIYNADNNKIADSYVQSGWYWYPHVQLMNHPDETEELVWWPTTKNHKAAKDTFGLNTYGPDVELEFVFDYMERKVKEDKPFFVYHTSHLGHDAWDFFNHEEANKWPGTPVIKWDGKKYTRTKPNITGDNGVYDTHGTVTEQGIHTHINYLDFQVWQYMNKLKSLGIEDNTIFIFCADNGTSGYGKSSVVAQKGTHVPMIIYAPVLNMTKQGEVDIVVNLSDVLPTIADVVGVEIPESYEINGESLIPYLTTKEAGFRDWIYSYHKDRTLARGDLVMKDGNGIWYDVSKSPKNLISFPKITDWSQVSEAHRVQRDEIKAIIPQYDKYAAEHDAPKGGYGKVDPLKKE